MEVSATEFKTNFGRYLSLSRKEDIWIKKNGRTVAKLINTDVSSVDAITGILHASDKIDRHSIREERLSEYEIYD